MSSGNLGVDGEMASNLPSRSEESEMRLTERVAVDSFSSPFLRPKTFDKKEGIAACPVVIDLGGGRAGGQGSFRAHVFSVWRITAGKNGGEGLTGREAREGDRLRMDGRRFGSGSPGLGRQGD